MKTRFAITLLCLSLTSASAAAQGSDGTADEAARLTFEAGREAFAAGDYETALARFRSAYEMSARPMVLYSVAQALDRMRRDAETLEALREFLEVAPEDSPIRGEVTARVQRLEATLAEQNAEEEERARRAAEAERQAAADASEDDTVEPESSRPPLHFAVFLATAGLALGAGGVAVWTGLETLSLHDEYMAATDLPTAQAAYDDGTTFELVTNILIFGASGIAGVSILLLIFTDWGGDESEEQATAWAPVIALDPTGATVGARVRY